MNIFIRFAFSGLNYYGTQIQPDKPTIQGVLEEALSRIYNEKIKSTISSRLDKGVSALDFAINFQAPNRDFTLDYLAYYLKRSLPNDIFIKEVRQVNEDFSCRYDVKYKIYTYLIQAGEKRNPLLSYLTYQPVKAVSSDRLKEALELFKGTHDFRYFARPEKEDESTVLTIDSTNLQKKNGIYYLNFKGKSFLRYQIRFLVGACLRYEQNRLSLDTIKRLLNGENIPYQKLKAEPQALILNKLYYPKIDKKRKIDEALVNLN